MYSLISISKIGAAKALSDYLTVNSIANAILPQSETEFLICIEQLEDKPKAMMLIEQLLSNPTRLNDAQVAWDASIALKGSEPTGIKVFLSQVWAKTYGFSRFLSVWLLCVFGAQLLGFNYFLLSYFSFPSTLSDLNLINCYRLISPAFLHVDFTHFVMNMFWWLWLAGVIEKNIGTKLFILFFVSCGLSAHFLQYALEGAHFIGLSGIVYGLIGLAWVMQYRKTVSFNVVPPAIMGLSVIWMMAGFTGWLPIALANWAHLGGLLAGLLFGLIPKGQSNR